MRWSDEQFETLVGNLLRIGVLLAALVVLIGGILSLISHGSETIGNDYSIFHSEPRNLRGISGIIKEMLNDRSRGIIQFGILLLIATPVARVAFSLFAFFAMQDRLYIMVTLYVLAVLLYSLIWTQ